MRYLVVLIITAVLVACPWAVLACSDASGGGYVYRPKANLRSGPGKEHGVLASVGRNLSLERLEELGGWVHVLTADGHKGWIRGDLLSCLVVHIFKNEQELVVFEGEKPVLSLSVRPGVKGLGEGRYFGVPVGRTLSLSWPNRQDLREYLGKGQIPLAVYQSAILGGPEALGGQGLALCSGPEGGETCGAILASADFDRLMRMISGGARVEIYASDGAARAVNSPDALSQRVYEGAVLQKDNPAAGLAPGSRVPRLTYPGGDIQPDFATSADIVIRSVRHAGLDLQALVYEDMLLHPARYSGLDMGNSDFGAHRLVPVLFAYLKHAALSLSVDAEEAPFSFEAGDIVFFGDGDEAVPNRVGVVGENYNGAGLPLVVTVWDMGQSTREMDLLGRKNPKVIGHFRLTHLFDYQ